MKKTIDETNRRRIKQLEYNADHSITPTQIIRSKESIMGQTKVADSKYAEPNAYIEPEHASVAADPVVHYMSKEQLRKTIAATRKSMEKAARELDFVEAARFRDEMYELEKLLDN
jgi:excinuclease ABC subunit B